MVAKYGRRAEDMQNLEAKVQSSTVLAERAINLIEGHIAICERQGALMIRLLFTVIGSIILGLATVAWTYFKAAQHIP